MCICFPIFVIVLKQARKISLTLESSKVPANSFDEFINGCMYPEVCNLVKYDNIVTLFQVVASLLQLSS